MGQIDTRNTQVYIGELAEVYACGRYDLAPEGRAGYMAANLALSTCSGDPSWSVYRGHRDAAVLIFAEDNDSQRPPLSDEIRDELIAASDEMGRFGIKRVNNARILTAFAAVVEFGVVNNG